MLADFKELYVVELKCTTGSLFHALYWELFTKELFFHSIRNALSNNAGRDIPCT